MCIRSIRAALCLLAATLLLACARGDATPSLVDAGATHVLGANYPFAYPVGPVGDAGALTNSYPGPGVNLSSPAISGRLPVGDLEGGPDGDIITMVGGSPAWAPPSVPIPLPVADLAPGPDGGVLVTTGGVVQWGASPGISVTGSGVLTATSGTVNSATSLGTAAQALFTNAAGTASVWAPLSGDLTPNVAVPGQAAVNSEQGFAFSATAPTSGQSFSWSGSAWTPWAPTTGPPNGSWTVAAWWIDPAAGSDTANTGQSSGSPFRTWAHLASIWGTYSPRLRQNTTVTFLSPHTDNTDPVYWAPYVENGAFPLLAGARGASQQLATGTLASVVAKSQVGAGAQLTATLTAGLAAGEAVVNTTRNSLAYLSTNTTGNTWTLTQPITLVTPPHNASAPAEDNGWANGNAFTVYSQVSVNLAALLPIFVDNNGAFDNFLGVYALNAFDPGSVGVNGIQTNENVSFYESNIGRALTGAAVATQTVRNGYFNCDFYGSSVVVGTPIVVGGQYRGTVTVGAFGGALLESDFVALNSIELTAYGGFGSIYLASGKTLQIVGFIVQGQSGAILYGPGTTALIGPSQLTYLSTATSVFQETGGITISGSATACAQGANGVTCGITLSGPKLDATIAAGGFAGTAFYPGGGAVTNGSVVAGFSIPSGFNPIGTADQLLGVNHAGTALTYFTPAGDTRLVSGVFTNVAVDGIAYPAGPLTIGNSPYATSSSAVAYSALNLAGGAGWVTGALPTGHGGTGVASLTAHGVVVGEGAAALAATAAGASGVPLLGAGASADPAFGALNLAGAGTITGLLPLANFTPSATNGQVLFTSGGVTVWGSLPAGLSITGSGFWHTTSGALDGAASHGTAGQVAFTNAAATDIVWTSVSGDVTCSSSTPGLCTVPRINGATVPAAGALTTGNVLQVSGASALTYGPLNVAVAGSITGVLPVANGGTDASALTAHGLMVGEGSGPVATIAPWAVGVPLLGSGASADPAPGPLNVGGGSSFVTGALPDANQACQSLAGQLGGTTCAATVLDVNGASVPASGALVTGNVLQVSGASTLAYSPLVLSSSASVTGQLTVPNGGTGDATLTAHGVVFGEGSAPLQASGVGVAGAPLVSGGPGVNGSYGPIDLASTGTAVIGALATSNGGTGDTGWTAHGVMLGEGGGPLVSSSAGTLGQIFESSGSGVDPAFVTISNINRAATQGSATMSTTALFILSALSLVTQSSVIVHEIVHCTSNDFTAHGVTWGLGVNTSSSITNPISAAAELPASTGGTRDTYYPAIVTIGSLTPGTNTFNLMAAISPGPGSSNPTCSGNLEVEF